MSTDDEEIAEVARDARRDGALHAAGELADDHTGTIPVIATPSSGTSTRARRPASLLHLRDRALRPRRRSATRPRGAASESGCDYAFSVTSYAFPIQRAIRITPQGTRRDVPPGHFNTRSQDLEEAYHDAGQFYWGQASAWLAGKPIFSPDAAPVVLPRHRVQDIDTPEDWERAEWMFKALQAGA